MARYRVSDVWPFLSDPYEFAKCIIMIQISIQKPDDDAAIDQLMAEAFGVKRFERSVWVLRPGPPVPSLCLTINDDGQMVGSLRFWEVMLGNQRILLLGPLAVQPKLRGKGYGRMLVEEALHRAGDGEWDLVLVSGEVDYYPKFGFVPAAGYGLEWPGFIEAERLQLRELKDGALQRLPAGPLAVKPVLV